MSEPDYIRQAQFTRHFSENERALQAFAFSLVPNAADVDDILAFGAHYWSAPEGAVEPNRIPCALRAKMTVCTPPRGRW